MNAEGAEIKLSVVQGEVVYKAEERGTTVQYVMVIRSDISDVYTEAGFCVFQTQLTPFDYRLSLLQNVDVLQVQFTFKFSSKP
jgi:hypothetical protein